MAQGDVIGKFWVFDKKALELVEIEVTSMDNETDPMTRGLVRVGHLGVGFVDQLPENREAAAREGRAWIDHESTRLQERVADLMAAREKL